MDIGFLLKEEIDNSIRFTLHKKYLFPSVKLYSDDRVNRMNLFLLEAGDVRMHAMSAIMNRGWNSILKITVWKTTGSSSVNTNQ